MPFLQREINTIEELQHELDPSSDAVALLLVSFPLLGFASLTSDTSEMERQFFNVLARKNYQVGRRLTTEGEMSG